MAQQISKVLQQAILSLCKANYADKIEIDGIICISSVQTSDQHVVKIHQTVDPEPQALTNQSVVESALALSLGVGLDGGKSLATNVKDASQGQTTGAAGTGKKTPKGKKRGRKVADDDPDFLAKAKNANGANAESESGKKLRRSSKKQRVSYAETESLDSEESDLSQNLADFNGIQELYGAEEKNTGADKNVSFGSASVLLKLLADPKAKRIAEQKRDVSMMKGAGLLSGMREEIPMPPSQTPSTTDAFREKEANSGEVKEEPQWEDEYGGVPNEASVTQEISRGEKNAEELAKSGDDKQRKEAKEIEDRYQVYVKDEPEWDESQYGNPSPQNKGDKSQSGNQSSSVESNSGGQKTDSNKTDASKNKSILMNILKAPSIIEALGKNRKPGVYIDNMDENNSDSRDSGPKSSTSEQDNSLLYRLPYASFSELLFPNSSKNMLQPGGESYEIERGGRQLSTIDYLSSLHPNQDFSGTPGRARRPKSGPYKTRLKSGTTDPVRYKDLVGANDVNLSGEEVDEALKESTEEVYIPEIDPYESENNEVLKGSARRKGKAKYLGPKSVRERNMWKKDDFGDDKPETEEAAPLSGPLAGTYFRCNICTRIFADRQARDDHEEKERLSHQVHQCPICDGFFGSEETKAKHMEERHGIQSLSEEQRAQFCQKLNFNARAIEKIISKVRPTKTNVNKSVQQEVYKKIMGSQSQEEQTPSPAGTEDDGNEAEITVKMEEEEGGDVVKCLFCEMAFDSEVERNDHLASFHGVSKDD